MQKLIVGQNDLITWCKQNGAYGETILKQWTGKTVDGIVVDIKSTHAKSYKKLIWKCDICGYEWESRISNRTSNKNGCPACANKVATPWNNLFKWCCENKPWGDILISEWVGEDIQGNKIEMTEVLRGSGKKVKWRCKYGHTWYATIHHRVCSYSGCPECDISGTSYPEQIIFRSLKQVFPDAINRYKFVTDEYPSGIEYDIMIPSLELFIEYSAVYYHLGKSDKDKIKRDLCNKYGKKYIEIIDDNYNEMEHIYSESYICTKIDNSRTELQEILNVVQYILKQFNHDISEVDIESMLREAWQYSHMDIPDDEKIRNKYPELYKEYNTELNEYKNIDRLREGSYDVLKWTCTKCGFGKNGEWDEPLYKRARGRSKCPNCGYSWYNAQNKKKQKLKKYEQIDW